MLKKQNRGRHLRSRIFSNIDQNLNVNNIRDILQSAKGSDKH